MNHLGQKLSEYKSWLAEQPLSQQTKRTYGYRAHYFVEFAEAHSALRSDESLGELVARYREELQKQEAAKPSTINNTMAALIHFCRFLDVEPPKMKRMELDKKPLRALSAEEEDKFLQAIAHSSQRDRAIALVLMRTGLLIAECVALNVEDLRLTPATFFAPKSGFMDASSTSGIHVADRVPGQRLPGRFIPIDAETEAVLQSYLAVRQTSGGSSAALFVNRAGQRISVSGLDFLIRKIGLDAGLVLSALTLRQTWLVRSAQNRDIVELARLAGHKKLFTTRRYIIEQPDCYRK